MFFSLFEHANPQVMIYGFPQGVSSQNSNKSLNPPTVYASLLNQFETKSSFFFAVKKVNFPTAGLKNAQLLRVVQDLQKSDVLLEPKEVSK